MQLIERLKHYKLVNFSPSKLFMREFRYNASHGNGWMYYNGWAYNCKTEQMFTIWKRMSQ